MRWTHVVLVAILVVNAVQAGLAAAAFVQGGSRARRGESDLARYSRRHAGLLIAVSIALSVVPVLGLAGALSARLAVWVSVVAEAAAFGFGRRAIQAFHAEAYGSPGAAPAAASPASATAAEGAPEPTDS